MIVNFSEHNITTDYYAYVKEGTVRRTILHRVCDRLPWVVVSLSYKLEKPWYDRAVRHVRRKALAVFNLYGRGDVRMTVLLKECRKYGIRLEDLLCPDDRLRLSDVSRLADLIVLDYLENEVLRDVVENLHDVSEEARNEAMKSVHQFASLAADKINLVVNTHNQDVQALQEPLRVFREDDLRASVEQLNAYSTALKELDPSLNNAQ